ncbi:hypothetical protein [Gemmatimonas sp.]|jgi:hypothetical protein|uniref:hypothetical protein n=1 Tax=Gemmatimonas sp. TaxID=1962908 RepID=UPI00391FB64C
MTFNIFAGARRLALLAAVGIVAATAFFVVSERPYLSRDYVLLDADPKITPYQSTDACPYQDKSVSRSTMTPAGYLVTVNICVPAALRAAQPLADEVAQGWLPRVVGTDEMRALDEDGDRQVATRRKEFVQIGAVAIVVLGVCTWAIGWVLRGFLGIPLGMDRKPPAAETPASTGGGT